MYSVAQANNSRLGTCPHGLPIGACPICNGMMGGGGAKKADFSAKPGEMSWNECAAIGAFLKAQQQAKLARQQDALNFAQQAIAFQSAMTKATQTMSAFNRFMTANFPTIARPVNFVINNIATPIVNTVKNFPNQVAQFAQNLTQKLADMAEKITSVIGEIKTAISKKLSEVKTEIKKKIKSLFRIFSPQNNDNEDKKIEESKKIFQLKTFINDLYRKITNKKDERDADKNI